MAKFLPQLWSFQRNKQQVRLDYKQQHFKAAAARRGGEGSQADSNVQSISTIKPGAC